MTTNEKVEYELGLKDLFSGPLKEAEGHAKGFHESVMHIIEALGIMELAHKVFEEIGESLKEYEAHQVAVASLTQMYKNNTDSVGMNVHELEELAEAQQKLTGIHSEEIMKGEQTLMKYKQIKVSYEELIPVIGNFAKATGQDASEAANTLGRALENPERAARLLMQAGISPDQQKMYRTLSETGDAAKAQGYLIEILGDKYKGVAKAMFDADITAQLGIEMKNLKEEIGGVEDSLLRALMPAIKSTFTFMHNAIEWVKEHQEGLKEIATLIGVVVGGYVTYKLALIGIETWEKLTTIAMATKNTVMLLAEAYAMATAEGYTVLEAAQWALNVAMDANPIGLVIIALTALVAIVYEVYKHWDQITKSFENSWDSLKSTAKLLWDGVVTPVKAAFHEVKSLWAALTGDSKKAAEEQAIATELAAKPLDELKQKQKDLIMREFYDKQFGKKENVEDPAHALEGSGVWGKDEKGLGMKPKSEAVKGQSHITINVSIKEMIGIQKLITQKLEGGVNAASDGILKMLLGTVDQFAASAEI